MEGVAVKCKKNVDSILGEGCVNNSTTFEEALAFAKKAHEGQKYELPGDKEKKEDYFNHVVRVAGNVSKLAKVVALLHGCLECAGELPSDLHDEHREALYFLARDTEMSYEDYILRITNAPGRSGMFAREVKVADIEDDLSHVPLGSSGRELRDRYEEALLMLRNPFS